MKRTALTLALLVGCGNVSSPKDVEVLKLKPVMFLQALPGTDSVTLSWTANNSESDFSGFNIYVSSSGSADLAAASLGLEAVPGDENRSRPILFKDSKDKDIESVRPGLAKYFNWDTATKTNVASTDPKVFNPLVRCNVAANDKGGECVAISDANLKNRANGLVTYKVTGLNPEKRYTFFVTSSLDKGKKIVSPTSDVITISPRKVQTLTAAFTASGSANYVGIDLKPATAVLAPIETTSTEKYCTAKPATTSAASIYFESSSTTGPKITGANGSRVQDLGPVSAPNAAALTSGLLESNLRLDGTALVPSLAVTPSNGVPLDTDIGAAAGYSTCGRSLDLLPNRLYGVVFVDNNQWRYSIIETSATETISNISQIRFVVANAGERRL